jgi:hypothetical protein
VWAFPRCPNGLPHLNPSVDCCSLSHPGFLHSAEDGTIPLLSLSLCFFLFLGFLFLSLPFVVIITFATFFPFYFLLSFVFFFFLSSLFIRSSHTLHTLFTHSSHTLLPLFSHSPSTLQPLFSHTHTHTHTPITHTP